MPGRNGTGSARKGAGAGKRSNRNGGRGRMRGTRPGSGSEGNCICPSCGTIAAHQMGTPCCDVVCPNCNTKMVRQ